MSVGLEHEKSSVKELQGRSDGRSHVEANLTVEAFEQHLVKRQVGIRQRDATELANLAQILAERGYSKAEAWSLIVSVEQWAQARTASWIAFWLAIVALAIGGAPLLLELF